MKFWGETERRNRSWQPVTFAGTKARGKKWMKFWGRNWRIELSVRSEVSVSVRANYSRGSCHFECQFGAGGGNVCDRFTGHRLRKYAYTRARVTAETETDPQHFNVSQAPFIYRHFLMVKTKPTYVRKRQSVRAYDAQMRLSRGRGTRDRFENFEFEMRNRWLKRDFEKKFQKRDRKAANGAKNGQVCG